METIGYAALQVIPSVKGAQKALQSQVDPGAAAAGKSSGQKLGVGLVASAKKYAKIAGGVVAAYAVAKGVQGGWDRALNIDAAQAKLRGLGHDAKAVALIMDSATLSVKGTAFGLDAAATSAATAVAAGIAPGKELTRYLGLTADAATIAGVSMGEMGSIFGKVQTAQKAYTAELNMLADRGLPIYQWLQTELGVTAEELRKMVAAGQIDSATFYRVIEQNIGGAAKTSGDSMRGMLANTGAAFSRLGANVMTKAFPAIKKGLGGIITFVDGLAGPIERAADGLGSLFSGGGGSGKLAGAFSTAFNAVRDFATDVAPTVKGVFADIRDAAGPIFSSISQVVTDKLLPAFSRFLPVITPVAKFLVGVFGGAVVEAFKGIGQLVSGVLTTLSGVLDFVTGVFTGNWSLAWDGLKSIVSGVFNGIVGAVRTYLAVGVLKVFQLGFNLVRNAATTGWNAIKNVFTGGLNLINTVLQGAVNVITWPFRTAIAGARNYVTTGWQYITGRFSGGVGGIQAVLGRVLEVVTWPFRTAMSTAQTVIRSGFDLVRGAASKGVGGVKSAIELAWNGITGIVTKPMGTVLRGFNTFLGAIDTVMGKVSGGKLGLSHRVKVPAGWREGGYTGRMHPDQVAGVVHGDEHVIRSESRRRIERQNPGLLDYMNQHGTVPADLAGYRKGGRVWPVKGSRKWTTYRGHTGIDFPRPTGTEVYAAHDGRVDQVNKWDRSYGWHVRQSGEGGTSIYAHLSKILVRVGEMLSAGQKLGLVGSTGNSTGPHLHYERRPPGTDWGTGAFLFGAGEPKGGGGFASRFLSGAKGLLGGLPSFDDIFNGLKSALRVDGIVGQIAGVFPSMIKDGVTGWLKDKLNPFDRGGLAYGTGLMLKDTIQPERILSPAESSAFQRWMDRGASDGRGPVELSPASIQALVDALGPVIAEAMVAAAYDAIDRTNRAAAGHRQRGGLTW